MIDNQEIVSGDEAIDFDEYKDELFSSPKEQDEQENHEESK